MANKRIVRTLSVAAVALWMAASAWAQASGRIEGRIVRADGSGIGGVTVVVEGAGVATVSDNQGNFTFERVPAGERTLSYTLGEQAATDEIEIDARSTTQVTTVVDWEITFVETITVRSASRQTERITEAPAAVTVVSEEQIEREAATGQLPKLLEFSPGAEVTQSGIYDFNFNTRGFNSSLNRRILTLIDGRDPSVPFLGSQEWSALTFPLDDVASLELVRGPGSALYGADAFNGVLNIVTKPPRYSQGGKLQVTTGDLDTLRGDFRWAGELGGDWYAKVTAGYMESDDFTVSRNLASGGPEYLPCTAPGQTGCIEPELIPLFDDQNELTFGGVRVDKYFDGGQIFTLEGGLADVGGPTVVTGIGRVQILDVERPWARANFNTPHWNFLGFYNKRDASDQVSLRSGGLLVLDTENYQFEAQGNYGFGDGRGRIIGGAYFKEEDIDSAGPNGAQTLMFESRSEDFEGVFAQLDWSFTDEFKAVLAARLDDSSLHDSELSPRLALVYSITPNHTVRAGFSEAFQVPNYSEFFLRAAVAPPITGLTPLELGICAPLGVSCGFDRPLPVLAVGNPSLDVEEVESIELGYAGIINRRAFLTIDYYENDYENFITDLIVRFQPQLGGLINPLFPGYQAPAGLPEPFRTILVQQLQGIFGPQFAFLSNSPVDGSPLLAPVSYVNFGAAEASGVEVGLNYYFTDAWVFDASFTSFDLDVNEEDQLAADPVLANTADNRFSLGLSYIADNWDASFKWRSVEGFDWNAGVFRGRVSSYDVANLTANYEFADHWRVGLDVSNLFDDEHFEAFGGDLLERRALVRLGYVW